MQCPRCKIGLTKGRYQNKEAMHCAQCSGVMLKQRDLTFILERLSKELLSNNSTDAAINYDKTMPPAGRCPVCKTPMEHYGYMNSKDIMIDFCEPCNWVWVDPGELFLMAQKHLKSEKELALIRASKHQGIDMVGIAALERSFLDDFWPEEPLDIDDFLSLQDD